MLEPLDAVVSHSNSFLCCWNRILRMLRRSLTVLLGSRDWSMACLTNTMADRFTTCHE